MGKLPEEELIERLRQPDATEDEVLAYLEHRVTNIVGAGGVAMPIDQYWAEGDLERYRAAAAVWVKDAPPRFALPDLPTLLNGISGPVGMPLTSFMDDLTRLWTQYAAWMQSEERDPYHPVEDPKAKRARIARESMARTRARRSSADPELALLLMASKARHDEYLMACRGRKEALEQLDAEVRRTWAAYEEARDAAKSS